MARRKAAMTISNGLAMSWEEWHEHDAVALADLVRAGKVTAKELCAQTAAAVARIDPQIEAVLGLYDDVVADPDKDGPSKEGRLYGVPMLLKGRRLRSRGTPTRGGLEAVQGPCGRGDGPPRRQLSERRIGADRQVDDTRIRHDLRHGDRLSRPGQGDAQSLEAGADPGRLLGRFSGGRCRRDTADQHVLRRRWVYPHPCLVLRPRRAQGNPRPRAPAIVAERIRIADQY